MATFRDTPAINWNLICSKVFEIHHTIRTLTVLRFGYTLADGELQVFKARSNIKSSFCLLIFLWNNNQRCLQSILLLNLVFGPSQKYFDCIGFIIVSSRPPPSVAAVFWHFFLSWLALNLSKTILIPHSKWNSYWKYYLLQMRSWFFQFWYPLENMFS